jgi:long-chain fatty acid transport protein
MYRVLLLGGVAAATQLQVSAWGAGFAIREQSASFQGASFAGVAAGGPDISTMFFNPATLARHDGTSLHLAASYVAPRAEFELEAATDGAGGPVTGPEGGDIAENAIVPAVYGATRWGDVHFGVGITAPFGLRTEQPTDWVGRYHATESELTTVNINPVLAYAVSERLSIAAGFVAQYADARLARALDLSGPGRTPDPATDAVAEVTGEDWDYGFTLGVLAEPIDGTRVGLGYRSQINHSLEGEFDATAVADGAVLRRDTGRAALATPQVASLGVRQRLSARVDLLGTLEWTGWSSFDELRIGLGAGDEIVTEERWNDSWFVALGAEYRPRDELAVTVGAAFDQSPIEERFRTPRIPGNDRRWLSVGVAWTPSDLVTIGGGYSHLFVADGDVDLAGGPTDAGGRGDLRGRFDNGVEIVTVHGTLRF